MAATVNRVSPSELRSLDAKLHQQEILNIFRRLKRVGAKSIFELKMIVTKGTTPTTLGFDYKSEGFRFIRSQNVLNNELTGDYLYIDADCNEAMKRSVVKKGDVLTNIVGASIGRTAVYYYEDNANTNQAVAIIKSNNSVDSHYLSTWMNSNLCLKVIAAQQSGNARDNFDLEQVREIEVPLPPSLVQIYIGDKIRQAEQLRAWAKSIQQQAAELIPAHIREIQRYEAKSYIAKEIIPERLDSLFYHPDYIALDRKMNAKGCKRLGLITKQIKDSWNKKKAEEFEYYEIGGLDITTGQVSSTKTPTARAPSRAKTKVQQGDVLVSTVRPNRKNVGFIVDSESESEMVATSGYCVLRFSSLVQAAFYHAWLRTDDATAQLMRWNSGSAYPAIDDDVPLNIIVPDFEQPVVESWGQKLLDAQFAYVYARRLTEAAKTLVEALIEGQLTEQQLIEAQQALDDGDNSLDQMILSKLSHEGYGIDGATPFFSDIDELYRLLESASEAEGEE